MKDQVVPLIDGDLLAYESCMAIEYGREEVPPFEWVRLRFDDALEAICKAAGGTLPPEIYLTGEGNFRYDVAKVKPYKGNRDGVKPWHYANILSYLTHSYGAFTVDGMEADDALAIRQTQETPFTTVICTRDKDLLQVPGWHYGWENGLQGERYLHEVDVLGEIHGVYGEKNGKPVLKKIEGSGEMFFYAQMLIGDTCDHIPGLPGAGDRKALDVLSELTTVQDLHAAVCELYEAKYEDEWKEQMTEQAHLLWMVRTLKDGKPVMWDRCNEEERK